MKEVRFSLLAFIITIYSSFAVELTEIQASIYNNSSLNIHQRCSGAAADYCGKTSRSRLISENEFACLHDIVTRRTKNAHSLDKSKCGRTIKHSHELAELNSSGDNGNRAGDDAIRERVFDGHFGDISKSCVTDAVNFCGKTSRSMAINRDEYNCLYGISTRLTKDGRPGYDGGKCDRVIRSAYRSELTNNQDTSLSEQSSEPGCPGGSISADHQTITCPDGSVYQRNNSSFSQLSRSGLIESHFSDDDSVGGDSVEGNSRER